MEATVDPLPGDPDWMPITPKRGSLFHAETHLICEALAGGPASPLWRVFAMAYRSMLPHMVRLNLAPADDDDSDTLADRLVAAAAAMRAQIIAKPQSCAWAIRP